MSDNYVLEWSESQRAFHIQEAAEMIEKNIDAFMNNRSSDYIVICIAPLDICEKRADILRHYLKHRKSGSTQGEFNNRAIH